VIKASCVLRGLIQNCKITMLMKLFFSDEKTALIGNADCLNNLVIFTVILQMKKMCILK